MTPSDKPHPLPTGCAEILRHLAMETGLGEFVVYGGAALDILFGGWNDGTDIDIAVLNPISFHDAQEHLTRNGHYVDTRLRRYYLSIAEMVVLFHATIGSLKLDIGLFSTEENFGRFDIESLYWKYPDCAYIDRHDAIRAFRKRDIHLIRDIERENPYLVLKRLIVLSTKYTLNMSSSPISDVVTDINRRITTWQGSSEFHNIEAPISLFSSVLRAVLRSGQRHVLLSEIVKSKALLRALPETHRAMERLNRLSRDALQQPQNKTELCRLIKENCDICEADGLMARCKLLTSRWWSEEDQDAGNWALLLNERSGGPQA